MHREDKKQAKRGKDKNSTDITITYEEEMKKQKKGRINDIGE